MRVTQNMLNRNMLMNLNRTMREMERLQNQLSSGKKISKPSDDPVVAVRGMQYRSNIDELEQYKRNAEMAANWLDVTDEAIQQAEDILKRVRELIIQGKNGTLDDESRKAIAREIEQLKDHLGTLANTSIAGRYIFAGTATQTPPYDGTNFINNNSGEIKLEIGKGIEFKINTNGTELFGYTPSNPNSPGNIFNFMDSVIGALDPSSGSSSSQNLDTLLGLLEEYENNFLRIHASVGARQNRLELMMNRLEDQIVLTTSLLSKEEDADLAEVITNLKTQENVYRAALGAGARIIQPTLLDFLR